MQPKRDMPAQSRRREETEEELRTMLASDDASPPLSETPDQQRDTAAEELITGDSDDLPLSEEVVEVILRMPFRAPVTA